jgi:spermidine synthase
MSQVDSTIHLEFSNSQSELIKDGWFFEKENMWPGQKFGIKVENVLINGKSDFQDILVFKSSNYGTVLVLDGAIQVTERDEFSYQEMISHLPLFAHKNPKKVLIIGGGDGGVLREVAKHSCVEEIHMCEIDEQVVNVSKNFFPETLAQAYGDPRLKLMFCDAAKYLLEEGPGQNYDVIICDSSDPIGPAEDLFKPQFFVSMHNALSPTGILCTQGECMWLHLDLIKQVLQSTRNIFGNAKYAYTTIPSYPSGQIGFILATKDETNNVSRPSRNISKKLKLKYYSNEIHKAAFVLPEFASKVLG